MDGPTSKRIVLLGKSGVGKSSLANTILGENVFKIDHTPISDTGLCHTKTKSISGRSVTLIDTAGFFDTERSEEDMKPEIVRCITECAPGPHAFLIVLKVEKFTKQEQAVITKICQNFSEDALKYAVIVFTHGDQLPEEMKIEEYVGENKNLSDLVTKCGGRCHVVDDKYWKAEEADSYRSNKFQVAELLKTLDEMIEVNKGSYYTNDGLQKIKSDIQKEEERIKNSSGSSSQEEAKRSIYYKLLIKTAGVATGVLLEVLLGVGTTLVKGGGLQAAAATVLDGVVKGAVTGYGAAEGAQSPGEAAQMSADAVRKQLLGDENNK